jgi:polyphenol oxidase
MELLSSTLLSARHGFLTRSGGVSLGPFASLNLSFDVGDAAMAVAENVRLAAMHAGVEPPQWVTLKQVHSARLASAIDAQARVVEADGTFASSPGLALAIRTADCVPVLMQAQGGRQVAALHAGWRGVADDIVGAQVRLWAEEGVAASDIRVALGPCIQPCCFEVDGDLPARFAAQFGAQVVVFRPGKVRRHLDLHLALRVSLERLGVQLVDALTACTVCDGRFFSHRRDAGQTGRQASFICTPAR